MIINRELKYITVMTDLIEMNIQSNINKYFDFL